MRSTTTGRGRGRMTREFTARTRGGRQYGAMMTGPREARREGTAGGRAEGRASRNKRAWADYWLPRNA